MRTASPNQLSLQPTGRVALAVLSAVGAYFFVSSLVLMVAMPFRYVE